MPKFIGNTIPGCQDLPDNACPRNMVRLSYSQAVRLPAEQVYASLDTTDRGGKNSYAKRWNRWYAYPSAILNCEKSTENMRDKAIAVIKSLENSLVSA